MGVLRTLLALSVVAGHCGKIFGLSSVGGVIAVQTFYMISGFYMALILSEKYQPGVLGYRIFIINRLLRLLPIYWIVLGLTIIVSAITHAFHLNEHVLDLYINNWKSLHPLTLLYLAFTNLFVFLQDTLMFLKLNHSTGGMSFTANFRATEPQLFSFLFLPQAWTLSVELTFYLFAPFLILLRLPWILLLIALSVSGRIVFHRVGLYHDPWTYRFFPFELAFFLIGRLSFELYRYIMPKRLRNEALVALLVLILLWTLFFDRIGYSAIKYAYFACVASTIPFLFHLTRDWKADRWIGELSYPIYISHVLVWTVLIATLPKEFHENGNWLAGTTILVAIILVRFVGVPIEKIRQARRITACTGLRLAVTYFSKTS